jgi:hypothetical protein
LYLLMIGLDTPETYRGWRNILRISCASSWFFFMRLYRDARSTKPKDTPFSWSLRFQTVFLEYGVVMFMICVGIQFHVPKYSHWH